MVLILVIVAHCVGIVVLCVAGLKLNQVLNDYAGLVSVLSLGVGTYTTALSLLYQRHRGFFLFVNRYMLRFRRRHTYWMPVFRFSFHRGVSARPDVETIRDAVAAGQFGRVIVRSANVNKICLELEKLGGVLVCTIDDGSLVVEFDRSLLVPSHLYEVYRTRLHALVESICQVTGATVDSCCVQISFGDGQKNPYYGFFVNHIPESLLQTFHVSFRCAEDSRCRIEAAPDQVSVEGGSIVEVLGALQRVLSLQALPKEGD